MATRPQINPSASSYKTLISPECHPFPRQLHLSTDFNNDIARSIVEFPPPNSELASRLTCLTPREESVADTHTQIYGLPPLAIKSPVNRSAPPQTAEGSSVNSAIQEPPCCTPRNTPLYHTYWLSLDLLLPEHRIAK